MAVTLFYFPAEPMEGDIDNIVKPILDALSRHVYIDDHQVERVVVQKFEPERYFSFTAPSDRLTEAIAGEKPKLYIKLSTNPFEELNSGQPNRQRTRATRGRNPQTRGAGVYGLSRTE